MSATNEKRCEHGMPVGTDEACPYCSEPSSSATETGSAYRPLAHKEGIRVERVKMEDIKIQNAPSCVPNAPLQASGADDARKTIC